MTKITITISPTPVGYSYLYEKVGRRGHRKRVPTYRAVITQNGKPMFKFAVTRDASRLIFGPCQDRFGTNGECPPSLTDEPYHGILHTSKRHPFALRLYEPKFKDTISLQGAGHTVRTDILIHAGTGTSHGCFLVAGGTRGFAQFRKQLERYLENSEEIIVAVEPRPATHQN